MQDLAQAKLGLQYHPSLPMSAQLCLCKLQGATLPPPRLSERDLISLMERHGIGTDATVAEHIQKQLDRGYATKDHNLTFWPTPLGVSPLASQKTWPHYRQSLSSGKPVPT